MECFYSIGHVKKTQKSKLRKISSFFWERENVHAPAYVSKGKGQGEREEESWAGTMPREEPNSGFNLTDRKSVV